MRIVVLTVGTDGDILPFVALGVGLRLAGHSVRIATHARFAPTIWAAGLDFAPLPGDPRALLAELDAELRGTRLDSVRFGRFIERAFGQRAGEAFLHDAQAACREAELILYRDALAFVGSTLAEALDVRPIAASLMPRMSTRPAAERWSPLGGALTALGDRMSLHLFWLWARRSVNRWRAAELGLRPWPLNGPYAAFHRQRIPILCGFSEAVFPKAPDWPAWCHVTGFWLRDSSLEPTPPAALVDFLAAGPPPVYVGFGSMQGHDAVARTGLVVEALARAGRRGVLATGWGGLAASAIGRSACVAVVESVSHTWLFPRVAAVAHHGGAGTTGAGLRAGRPTVIVPSAFDQPFWGRRVAALGAGPEAIPRQRLTAARLAEAIRAATTDEDIRRRAGALGQRLRDEDGVATAVAAITRHLETEPWRWDR